MNKRKRFCNKSSQQGVVIVEALIAILLFSMGVLAIVGLQAAMVRNTADSKFRADASYIAQQCIGEMWTAPAVIGTCAGTKAELLLPNGVLDIVAVGNQYTVTVTWQKEGEDAHNFITIATIAGN